MDAINFLDIIFVFAFGAVVGSFLNVLLFRKNTGESVVTGGSRCFSCGKKLGVIDLIPILSFLWLNGRCRYCGSRISIQYPIVEALIGLLAVLVYLKIFGEGLFIIRYIFFIFAFSSLFLVAAYDFRAKIIDISFLLVFGALSVIEFAVRNWSAGAWIGDAVSSFLIALFFYLMWKVSGGRWMGRGDANLALFTSLFLGWALNLAALFWSFWIGGVIGALLLFRRKFNLKSEIPFGPFLAAGAFLVWYLGDLLRGMYDII